MKQKRRVQDDVGFPPAIPAINTRYQVKLAPSSNQAVLLNPLVKTLHATCGAAIAKLARRIPFQPESTLAIISSSRAVHSAVTNEAWRMKGDIAVNGNMWIPWMYSGRLPNQVVQSALFMKRIPVTKLGTNAAGWMVLFGDINIYEFMELMLVLQ